MFRCLSENKSRTERRTVPDPNRKRWLLCIASDPPTLCGRWPLAAVVRYSSFLLTTYTHALTFLVCILSLDVPTGVYMLEVQSPHLVYSRVRVIVHANESVQASRVSVGDHWSSRHRPLSMPLTLKPQPRPIHYIVRAKMCTGRFVCVCMGTYDAICSALTMLFLFLNIFFFIKSPNRCLSSFRHLITLKKKKKCFIWM